MDEGVQYTSHASPQHKWEEDMQNKVLNPLGVLKCWLILNPGGSLFGGHVAKFLTGNQINLHKYTDTHAYTQAHPRKKETQKLKISQHPRFGDMPINHHL